MNTPRSELFRRELLNGLVGDEHMELYRHSASFKAAMHALADSVIPAMVRGFAVQAKEMDDQWRRHQRMVEAPWLTAAAATSRQELEDLLGVKR